ncbi:receptor-like protein kinase [Dorcoceras hygrometricum]|uniref:Receptor-like protein kinase n=1 Tax=Dorcoceras hygrometricum TaxID=472368 RepID=A0A2Z7AY53_9LAMI|nr:receptor-like protein kinase [Dorcoceras hygrometricum]
MLFSMMIKMSVKHNIFLSRVNVLVFVVFLNFITSSAVSDAEILVKFRQSLKNAGALSSWEENKSPCNGDHEIWNGVLCEQGTVWGLKLENMGLKGVIDVEALAQMPNLRTISFMNNNFDGPLPDLHKITAIKTIYLSNNKFSGEIPPADFSGMSSLKKIYLANNKLSGPIPESLAALPRLKELTLENNEFSGFIPSFPQDRLKVFNVSNNKLEGEIPNSLSGIDASAFSGNKDLCGAPLKACSAPSKVSIGAVVIVALLVVVAIAALVVVFIILRRCKKSPQQPDESTAANLKRMEQGQANNANASSPDHTGQGKKAEQSTKLTFLKEDGEKFDMPDLLKASAEILGSGVFGSTYKTSLNEGKMMVVKRFRHMNNVSKEEFNEHMRRLGRLNHENLLPIVAFYYRKEEKLLVSDYAENISLAVHLHGNRSRGIPCPDWPTRLKIVKGVAKGLAYLYNELPCLTAPHGHLKSSNVLLDATFNPLLSDYGFIPIVNQEHAQEHMVAYKSPEYKHTGRITKKTDVWSFGILVLEVLTGRFPSNFLQQGNGTDTDLATWVDSVVRDESNLELVLDRDMAGTGSSEGEIMKLLRVALRCCEVDVESRPEFKEVTAMVDEVKDKDDEFYSSYASEGDTRSSRGLSDDFHHVTFK